MPDDGTRQDPGDTGSTQIPAATELGRRQLLRRAAIVAAASAAAAAAQVATAGQASAAVGDPITVGGSFIAPETTTKLALTGSDTVPTLTLANPTGPSLRISGVAVSQDKLQLAPGSLAANRDGLLTAAVDTSGVATTTYVATGYDLANIPVPTATTPVRILDTRTAAGRSGVVASSSSPYDSTFRLKAGSYLDVAIDTTDQDFTLDAAYLNVTVTGSSAGGYLTVYPPGDWPGVSTLNFDKSQTIANGTFVGVGVVQTSFVVRVQTTATVHVVVDLTGAAVRAIPGPDASGAAASRARRAAVRVRPAMRKTPTLGRSRHR